MGVNLQPLVDVRGLALISVTPMANLATRVAAAAGALSSRRRKVYLVLFALTARVWIDETTEAIHRSRDVDERLRVLEEVEADRQAERELAATAAAVDATAAAAGLPPADAPPPSLRERAEAASEAAERSSLPPAGE